MINVVGNLVTLKLIWINSSQKSVDDIQFSVDYYTIYDEYVTTKSYNWGTNWFTDPIKPGYQYTYVKAEYIKSSQSIKKYVITINRVHFTDGTYCKR